MTRYQLEFLKYAQKSFTYVAEALTPLLRLGTISWIVTQIFEAVNIYISRSSPGPFSIDCLSKHD